VCAFFRLRPAAKPLAVNYYIISIISFPRVRLPAVLALEKNAHAPLFVFTDGNNKAEKIAGGRARQKSAR
jgi:hypothetical protein